MTLQNYENTLMCDNSDTNQKDAAQCEHTPLKQYLDIVRYHSADCALYSQRKRLKSYIMSVIVFSKTAKIDIVKQTTFEYKKDAQIVVRPNCI